MSKNGRVRVDLEDMVSEQYWTGTISEGLRTVRDVANEQRTGRHAST